MLQIDGLKCKNKALEEQLQLAAAGEEAGKRDTAPGRHEGKKLHSSGKLSAFRELELNNCKKFIENRDLGNPDNILIHVGANDLRSTRNLDYLVRVVYSLVATAKSKFPHFRLLLI